MEALSKQFGWNNDWFFDGRKALFAPNMIFAQHEDMMPVRKFLHLVLARRVCQNCGSACLYLALLFVIPQEKHRQYNLCRCGIDTLLA